MTVGQRHHNLKLRFFSIGTHQMPFFGSLVTFNPSSVVMYFLRSRSVRKVFWPYNGTQT